MLAENLWHVVFISHRWGNQDNPDPSGSQLAILKLLAQRIADVADVLSDERIGVDAVRDRLARVPSLARRRVVCRPRIWCFGICVAVLRLGEVTIGWLMMGFWI